MNGGPTCSVSGIGDDAEELGNLVVRERKMRDETGKVARLAD